MNQQNWMQVAEVGLVYKAKVKPSDKPKVTIPADCHEIFLQQWDLNRI